MDISPLNGAEWDGQTTTYTGTAGTVTGWQRGPKGVYVVCSTAAYVRVGAGVTATTGDYYLPANVPITFLVPGDAGTNWTVSAIQVASGGSVYAKPVGGA